MTKKKSLALAVALASLVPFQASGQASSQPPGQPGRQPGTGSIRQPPQPTLDCTKGRATEIDWWLGEWTVTRHADGKPAGTNRFTKEIGGCAIREEFRAKKADGTYYEGTSLSYLDPIEGQWYQFYVDNGGRRSVYNGAMRGDDWYMVAPAFLPGRGPFLMRMVVRRNPDGSVRQMGGVSTDHGATWLDTYDLDYRKR